MKQIHFPLFGSRFVQLTGACVLIMFSHLSCDRLDPAEPLPVYLQLKGAEAIIRPEPYFGSDIAVKDLWIDHNGEALGVFRLPTTIPLIREGDDNLTISGGIFESGLSSQRARYPFWLPQSLDIGEVQPLDTIVIEPAFEYLIRDSILTYGFEETFESASPRMLSVATSNPARLINTTEDRFMGIQSGKATFTSVETNLEVVADEFIPLPQQGTNIIYMEITYRNVNIPFTAGLLFATLDGQDAGDLPATVFFFSEEWNTVYINFNDAVRAIPSQAAFKPYIRASSINRETGEAVNGSIFIDNIRILYFTP